MPDRNLTGLVLTRSERIVVVALSYLYVAPLIFAHGKRILAYLRGTSQEVQRRQERLRRAQERRERAHRLLRDYQESLARADEEAEREQQPE